MINVHARSRKSASLHFNGLLLCKAHKFLDEKFQKSYVSWQWRVMQGLKKNWLLVPKMAWGIWWLLMWGVAKICTLMCYFCRMYNMLEPKKYIGVMCHSTEEWCKIWRGTDLYFEKWHEGFVKFRPNTRNSLNVHFNRVLLTKVYNA